MMSDMHSGLDYRRADILDEAVERLWSGEDMNALIAGFADDANWLEPLLKLAVQVGALRESMPVASPQVSVTRFLSQAVAITSDAPKPPRQWLVSGLGLMAKRGRLVPTVRPTVVALGSVAAALLLAWLVLSQPWIGEQSPQPRVADFALSTGQGSTFSLSDHGGSIVVLYFAFPGCPTCRLEAPALGRIQREFNHKDVTVVAINTEASSTLAQWRDYWKSIGAGDVLWATDEGQSVIRLLRVTRAGTTIIIDRDRRISYRDGGASSYETIREALVKVL